MTIILKDGSENILTSGAGHAGIRVQSSATLTIATTGQPQGNGRLTAIGSSDSSSHWATAGIGGSELEPSGTIIIDGGIITARGGNGSSSAGGGPGIGGAAYRASGNITLNGGTITAIGGSTGFGGVGIGGGSSDPSNIDGKITINGGTIKAYSGIASDSGPGIGYCNTIAISNSAYVEAYSSGTVSAIYGTTHSSGHNAFLLNFILDSAVSADTDITITQKDNNADTFELTLLNGYRNFAATVETSNNYTAALSDGSKKVVSLSDEGTDFPCISESPDTALSYVSVKLKANPVCTIDSAEYDTLEEALENAVDGDTITLLKSIEYNDHIHLANKNITLDLNGFNFNLNNTAGDGLWVENGSWDLAGEGEFNVTSKYYAVYAFGGGSVTVTNVTSSGDGGFPAALASGSDSTVTVPGDSVAEGTGGKAVYSANGANIVVWGDAIATGYEGQAVYAPSGSATIHGDALTSGNNSYLNIYATFGGNILIKGNAEATGHGSYTLYSDGENSNIEVLGNVTGTEIGVYSRNSASALIHGNVTATAGYGIVVESSGNVNVLGDVSATGGAGASVSIGTATIEGSISASQYLILFGEIKTINDFREPTTKLGYRTYNHEDSIYGNSTVWIAAELPFATNVVISGFAIVGETLTGEYDFNGITENGSTYRWSADIGSEFEVFNTMNIAGVNNNPTVPAEFVLSETTLISRIWNYHWNYGSGAVPGTISLQEAGGTLYGPWDAIGLYGNLYWEVQPYVELPAGTYTVIDSSNETWAHNLESGYRGMTVVQKKTYSDDFTAISGAVNQSYLLTSEPISADHL